jgi:Ca2+-transporting ATPase
MPTAEVLQRLDTRETGLSGTEAARRLALQGPNSLREGPGLRPVQLLLGQFKSVLIGILVAAGIISGLLGEWIDFTAILIIVVLNAVIGFFQEYRAERSIAALGRMTAPRATVRRDGHPASLPAAEIVVGDILVLEAGDLVAADARLAKSAALRCVESALTGESDAVAKRIDLLPQPDLPLGDRKNMVFLGTTVSAGKADAIVVATGMQTELGRIAGLMGATAGRQDPTPLQQKLSAFGRILVWVTLGIVALLFGLGWLRGVPPLELFMTSVSLAVAAVPEGLPAIVTVALALGVSRMARRGALIRRLPAVETLGSTTVICTDKTGTLTLGQMTVRSIRIAAGSYSLTGEGYGPEGRVLVDGQPPTPEQTAALQEIALAIIACNNAHLTQEAGVWSVVGDPTEGALLTAGLKAGADRDRLEREMPRQREFPFDSDRKRSTVIRRTPEGTLRAFVNGAPGPLLQRCSRLSTPAGERPMTDTDRERILAETTDMARAALRILGSAHRDLESTSPADLSAEQVETDLVFVGLTGMYDPPRPAAQEAVARCHDAGIQVVMITGDHPETATAIAREIGITTTEEGTATGSDLDRLSEGDLQKRIPTITVYARVTAEHKLRIVQGWKKLGAVVAMTGDGVNDAPAIQGADIGISMGKTGTEVTRQASDMILTDDNFATIVAAVEEGRGIHDNIRKTLQYLLAGNTGELLLMTLCVIPGLPAPLLPIHLLWINLVTDGLPALCLAVDPIDPKVMKHKPRGRAERITDSGFLRGMGLTGLLTAGVAFGVYLAVRRTGTLELARTEAFAVLVYAELFRSFGSRSATTPVWRIPVFSNRYLAAVVAVSCGLQVWSHHSPLLGGFLRTTHVPFSHDLILLALGTLPLLILELFKGGRARQETAPTTPTVSTAAPRI